MRQDPPEPFLGSKGRKEHGQDRLSGRRGNLDVAGGAEAVGNELDQLLKHAQGMKMSLKEAIEFFALSSAECFPSTRLKKYRGIAPLCLALDGSRSAGRGCKGE